MEQERDRTGPADGERAATVEGPPAGWYPDLHDDAAERWWSGNEWTERRQPRTSPRIQTETTADPSPPPQRSLPAPSAEATGDLRSRIPAQSLIEKVIRLRAAAGPRIVGRSTVVDLPSEAESWYSGAVGERAVAAQLARLGTEWTVLHSVPVGPKGRDIDHLLISPAGVYAINTKHHAGKTVWVEGPVMAIAGRKRPYVGKSADDARLAQEVLTKASGLTVEAAGLIVLVGVKSLTVRSKPDGGNVVVGVVRDRDLMVALRSRRIYSDAQVQRIADAAVRPATWLTVPLPAVDTAALVTEFDELEREMQRHAATRSAAATAQRSRVRAPRPLTRAPSRPSSGRRRRRKPSALESVLQAGGFLLMAVIAYAMLGHH